MIFCQDQGYGRGSFLMWVDFLIGVLCDLGKNFFLLATLFENKLSFFLGRRLSFEDFDVTF